MVTTAEGLWYISNQFYCDTEAGLKQALHGSVRICTSKCCHDGRTLDKPQMRIAAVCRPANNAYDYC